MPFLHEIVRFVGVKAVIVVLPVRSLYPDVI